MIRMKLQALFSWKIMSSNTIFTDAFKFVSSKPGSTSR